MVKWWWYVLPGSAQCLCSLTSLCIVHNPATATSGDARRSTGTLYQKDEIVIKVYKVSPAADTYMLSFFFLFFFGVVAGTRVPGFTPGRVHIYAFKSVAQVT